MRISFLTIAYLLVHHLYAQYDLLLPKMHISVLPQMANKQVDADNAVRLALFLNLAPNEKLVKANSLVSPFAKHTTYKHFVNDKEVLFSYVKLHQMADNSVIVQSFLVPSLVQEFDASLPFLLPVTQGLTSVQMEISEHVSHPQKQYMNAANEIIYQADLFRYIKKDTIASGYVHAVNPINSADTTYGGSFVDNNNQTNSILDNERILVNFKATFDNDSFYLESDNLFLSDFSIPIDNNTYANSSSTYDFTRDKRSFEAVNAFYHINSIADYVKNAGYSSLVKRLPVDVHALGGDDNSAYDPTNHRLMFGDGGVDDAEDGEVVVHEFTHSISEVASSETTVGNERKAMEEGLCDYFAKAYSRSYNDNTPDKIFSWDGHNNFWDGFPINSKRSYPQDLAKTKDGDRDIWSSALMCVHDYVGRETMDSLVLEHLFYQGPNTTMPQMAQILLDIDSANFNKRNYSSLKTCFVAAGFMQHGASVDQVKLSPEIEIINSSGFANGEGNMVLRTKNSANWQVTDNLGRILFSQISSEISLNPSQYKAGVYFISINSSSNRFVHKFVRL